MFAHPSRVAGELLVTEKNATSFAMIPDLPAYRYMDAVNKSESGKPMVRGLIHHKDSAGGKVIKLVILQDKESKASFDINGPVTNTRFETLSPGVYEIELGGKVVNTMNLKLGGVYTVLGYVSGDTVEAHPVTVTDPNSMHILWLIPQYIVITMAEVMFSVTGLEFAFTQAPSSMKSLLQAGWLLTVAFGNLIVVIVAEVKFFDTQVQSNSSEVLIGFFF